MLREWSVAEQRYRAVLEVLDGASVTDVARRYGVSRQTVHAWLRRYAEDGGVVNLDDRTSRPWSCPHQMDPTVESRVLTLRDEHPVWGPDRIRFELEQEDLDPVPSRSGIYRALVRGERIDPAKRKRRRADYRRWERGRPMELWQMDIVGGVHLSDGVEVKCVTGIDDNSRFVVSAKLVARATARPVCEALLEALERHGVPEQILTDNGKVFTGRFGPHGSASEVLFDRVCAENGIRHLLTAPRSPTTTGKVERLHKTMRAECFRIHDRRHATIGELQAAVDAWVVEYNTRRPHQSLGMRPPAERMSLVQAPEPVTSIVPTPRPAGEPSSHLPQGLPPARSVGRFVGKAGQVRLAGFVYRVPVVLAGERVECVVAENLVQIFHRGVLVGSCPQRLARGHKGKRPVPVVVRRGSQTPGAGRPQLPVDGAEVLRTVDSGGSISFAGTSYRAGTRWIGQQVSVAVIGHQVQISSGQQLIRVHRIRHDRAKELGAYAHPLGHPGRIAKKARAAAARLEHSVNDLPNSDGQAATGD
jgi:transposase InsO family protein